MLVAVVVVLIGIIVRMVAQDAQAVVMEADTRTIHPLRIQDNQIPVVAVAVV
jgi:hypothetical protein